MTAALQFSLRTQSWNAHNAFGHESHNDEDYILTFADGSFVSCPYPEGDDQPVTLTTDGDAFGDLPGSTLAEMFKLYYDSDYKSRPDWKLVDLRVAGSLMMFQRNRRAFMVHYAMTVLEARVTRRDIPERGIARVTVTLSNDPGFHNDMPIDLPTPDERTLLERLKTAELERITGTPAM